MTEPLRYEITGVAGIDHAELELRPGVSILRGANGAGNPGLPSSTRRNR